MRFITFLRTNAERSKRWHRENLWSPLEWVGAMCGEAGEAANAAKKLKRIQDGMPNINEPGRSLIEASTAKREIAKEVADTMIYGALLVDALGITPELFEQILIDVFNKKSDSYGFPERLGA